MTPSQHVSSKCCWSTAAAQEKAASAPFSATRPSASAEGRGHPRLTERVLAGADGLVRETISWMARRSFSLCRGLLMPISRWISVSDRLAMMAPLFTLARHAATYQAGIPTHNWWDVTEGQQWRLEGLKSTSTN